MCVCLCVLCPCIPRFCPLCFRFLFTLFLLLLFTVYAPKVHQRPPLLCFSSRVPGTDCAKPCGQSLWMQKNGGKHRRTQNTLNGIKTQPHCIIWPAGTARVGYKGTKINRLLKRGRSHVSTILLVKITVNRVDGGTMGNKCDQGDGALAVGWIFLVHHLTYMKGLEY